MSFISSLPCDQDGDVRLLGLLRRTSCYVGKVQVCHDKHWADICYGDWTHLSDLGVAPVICRQLEFLWPTRHMYYNKGEYFVANVKCRGDEHNISQCVDVQNGTTIAQNWLWV